MNEQITEAYIKKTARILLDRIFTTSAETDPIIYYNEISAQTGRNCHIEVGKDVGKLSTYCNDLGLPLISVIVVGKKDDKPGKGFFSLRKQLRGNNQNKNDEEIIKYEMEEVKKCKKWYKLEDKLELENRKFTKDYIPTKFTNFDDIGKDYEFCDYNSDFKDISMGNKKRSERTARHQALVRKIAKVLDKSGYKLYEGIMDCAAVKYGEKTLLIEVKTLSSNGGDELDQVRKALGQLLYYEEFCLNQIPNCLNNNVIKVALFENKIQEKYIGFLQKYGCRVVWVDKNDTLHGIKDLLKLKTEI